MSKEYKFIYEDREICKDDIPEIKEWLKNNHINQAVDKHNYTLLEVAVIDGSLEVVDFLIKNGADKYFLGNNKWGSLIELASAHGHLEIIKYFLKDDFDRNILLNDNSLIYAAAGGFTDVIKYLISQGKNIEQPLIRKGDISEGFTALRMATQENSIKAVKLLCELGANVNVQGEDTPLYSAAAEGNLEVVKILLKYGANINQTVGSEVTPLSIAKYYGKNDVAEYLLALGADPTIDPS